MVSNFSSQKFSGGIRIGILTKLQPEKHTAWECPLMMSLDFWPFLTYLPKPYFVLLWQSYLFNDIPFWSTYPLSKKIKNLNMFVDLPFLTAKGQSKILPNMNTF